ncbi:MAG: crotonobetainyl-CoA:carnitine CoA-transferase CaiB-like acyl-CoA transferase [Candidatus Azotimanducaceae bacterium]|jgi:crotonobetainyl-CoA:carnitine CoA-transferase CaiB-like acyl-CoA transferase
MSAGILSSYMVLDFTDERGEIGPMLMGDLGADVIRVETPNGSGARRAPPFLDTDNADLRSLQFLAFNRNKRSICLDPDSDADKATLAELIARTDYIIESGEEMEAMWGISFAEAKVLNPHIIHVCITAFGSDGPYANLKAADLTIVSMAGPVALQGIPGRPPIRISVPQVWRHAGVEAIAGAMVAHAQMRRSGEAQFVDVSAQCVMTWTMLNAMDAWAIQGFEFERAGSALTQGIGKTELVHPTTDGYVVAIPLGRVLEGCTEAMIEDGIVDETFRDIDWDKFEANMQTPEELPISFEECTKLSQQFFAGRSRNDLFEMGLRNRVTLAPVNTLDELLNLEHMNEREYWQQTTLPNGQTVKSAGLWAKPSSFQLAVQRNAPSLGEHTDDIKAQLRTTEKVPVDLDIDNKLPFEGIKVADFAWVGVGPISAKYLADHGADVVRVESENRPDVLRGGVPMKDGEFGWNRSQFFGDFNTSKRSLALNMKSDEGRELAKKLIGNSDVFIESFAPGAVGRMGLGYEEVRKLNPGLIMISTCLMGQTGPASSLAGYGYHAAALAGFYEVTGWPDLAPSAPWVAYTDTIAPRFVSILLAAALDYRRRTGKGCFIDVAQIETALHFLGPEILDLQVNGHSAYRNGNRARFHAPQGVYLCSDEESWCAIAIEQDAQWQQLCDLMQRPDLARDKTLETHQGRIDEHDQLDEAIAQWTKQYSPHDAVAMLQEADIPAGVVQRSKDLLADPQYQHRDFYRYFDHPEMGNIPYAGHQYTIRSANSGYHNGPRGPAPCIGEHSFEVLSSVLGLSDDEIGAAYASGAIG